MSMIILQYIWVWQYDITYEYDNMTIHMSMTIWHYTWVWQYDNIFEYDNMTINMSMTIWQFWTFNGVVLS